MVGKMGFDVKCVKDCLVKRGKVFTVRSYLLEGINYRFVMVDGVGLCWRELVGEIKGKEDLVKYLDLSGFENVDLWWEKIVGFCGGKKKWLYFVSVYRNNVKTVYRYKPSPSGQLKETVLSALFGKLKPPEDQPAWRRKRGYRCFID